MKVLIVFLLFLFFPCFFVLAQQIDINTATLTQLDEITHIGPKTAQKIIDGRPYSSVSDLSRVKGIGNGKYLQDIISQGFACVNCQTTTPTSAPLSTPTPSPSPSPVLKITDNIFITEIMPSPEGPDEQNEWIKLFNPNNYDVNLSGWKLRDIEGTKKTYLLKQTIKANSELVLKRPETGILLNNDKDGLELLRPDGSISDSMKYEKAQIGQSYIKTKDGWKWTEETLLRSAKSGTTEGQAKVKETSSFLNLNSQSAEIKEKIPAANPNFKTYLIAFILAIFSATAIILLKINLKKMDKNQFFS